MKRVTQHLLDIGIEYDLNSPSVHGPDGFPRTTDTFDQMVSQSIRQIPLIDPKG